MSVRGGRCGGGETRGVFGCARGRRAQRNAGVPRPGADSYALLYDPAGWLQLDPRSGTVRTQRELRDPSAFLQGGWYIALLLARDDGDRPFALHPPPPPPPCTFGRSP